MLIGYDKSFFATPEDKIRSLAESVRRALDENQRDKNEQIENIKKEINDIKELQESQGGNIIPGHGDKHYTHVQTVAESTWTITHNLGKNPSVEVVDSAGTVVIGDVNHIDKNTVKIKFNAQFKGKAYLN